MKSTSRKARRSSLNSSVMTHLLSKVSKEEIKCPVRSPRHGAMDVFFAFNCEFAPRYGLVQLEEFLDIDETVDKIREYLKWMSTSSDWIRVAAKKFSKHYTWVKDVMTKRTAFRNQCVNDVLAYWSNEEERMRKVLQLKLTAEPGRQEKVSTMTRLTDLNINVDEKRMVIKELYFREREAFNKQEAVYSKKARQLRRNYLILLVKAYVDAMSEDPTRSDVVELRQTWNEIRKLGKPPQFLFTAETILFDELVALWREMLPSLRFKYAGIASPHHGSSAPIEMCSSRTSEQSISARYPSTTSTSTAASTLPKSPPSPSFISSPRSPTSRPLPFIPKIGLPHSSTTSTLLKTDNCPSNYDLLLQDSEAKIPPAYDHFPSSSSLDSSNPSHSPSFSPKLNPISPPLKPVTPTRRVPPLNAELNRASSTLYSEEIGSPTGSRRTGATLASPTSSKFKRLSSLQHTGPDKISPKRLVGGGVLNDLRKLVTLPSSSRSFAPSSNATSSPGDHSTISPSSPTHRGGPLSPLNLSTSLPLGFDFENCDANPTTPLTPQVNSIRSTLSSNRSGGLAPHGNLSPHPIQGHLSRRGQLSPIPSVRSSDPQSPTCRRPPLANNPQKADVSSSGGELGFKKCQYSYCI